MKVKCVKILSTGPGAKVLDYCSSRTVGKIYDVLALRINGMGVSYYLNPDYDGGYGIYAEAQQFEIVDNSIPKHWVVSYESEQTHFTLWPKKWEQHGNFVESLVDEEEYAVELYQEELRRNL